MKYPKIYLAIDNCFAYKRWTRPIDWMNIISDLGVNYIEASADTELDPLYMGQDYLARWTDDVLEQEQKTGVKVANLYSGHGTYTTLGLAHTEKSVRERFIEDWFKPMIDIAAKINAGLGFLVHGFPDYVLNDKALYEEFKSGLFNNLARINSYANIKGCKYLSLEQMYSPQMIPWTIDGTLNLMEYVTAKSSKDFYFTEDTGHHHTRFAKPTAQTIGAAFNTHTEKGLWLGSEKAFGIYFDALAKNLLTDADMQNILADVEEHSYLFTGDKDANFCEWIKAIGCYSPIIHLQQTNGLCSSHLPFTEQNNKDGIVTGKDVLTALKHSYDNTPPNSMAACDEIYLTLELFFGASVIGQDILHDYKASVDYWRQFVPTDGLTLDRLVCML